ncbi:MULTISPECIES: SdpA family antimicrobial peptide system protein [unclassified Corallococcus]|uniref:SdpA family antimicrobial peptide system protein n=1 Tax=unclassified Corallococcus TaxID=2685029 RepID=UPI001F5D3FA0|nr:MULTISPECIES: SdpA family antimicrobial peptide system protein [unclassified Corallococcus]WAS84895.1 SdpA family antimicrobial peptide system protein [Corallococcus sp. NCRR]
MGLLALGLLFGGSSVAAYALHAALPYNPLQLPFEDRFDIRLVLPEGWAFFTRDPRDERILSYLRTPGGQWVRANQTPNFQPRNAFGIDRAARAQGVEMGLLLEATRQLGRHACEEDPLKCLERAPSERTLRNESPNPTFCGQLGIVFQPAVPWAWSRSHRGKAVVMPSKVLRLDVEC